MTSNALRSLSLCTGVGGLELAVADVLPVDLVAYSEVDEDACRVLEHHFPGVPNVGDLTLADWSQLSDIQLVTAGYPCQPFSLAGRRKGTDDVRHLYPFISQAVRHLRPRYVVLENVPGHRSKGFGEVVADLSEIGYLVTWTSVRASDVGAPHRRERVFILAADRDRDRVRTEQVCERGCCGASVACGCDQASADSEVVGCRSGGVSVGAASQPTEPASGRDSSGVDWQEYTAAIRRWERVRGVTPYPLARGPRGGVRVSTEFGEWFMGLPTGWISGVPGVSLRAAARLYGNGVVPQQGARAVRILFDQLERYGELV